MFYTESITPIGKVVAVIDDQPCLQFLNISNHNPWEEIYRKVSFPWNFDELLHGQVPVNFIDKGTPFQVKVWEALRTIPFGTTTTYKQIAHIIEKPTAWRAVASAIGRNPISIVIPCHRVLGSDGKLHGYRWGKSYKEQLLIYEKYVVRN